VCVVGAAAEHIASVMTMGARGGIDGGMLLVVVVAERCGGRSGAEL